MHSGRLKLSFALLDYACRKAAGGEERQVIHGDTVLKIEIQPKDRTKLVLHCSIPNSTRQLQWDLRFAGDQVSGLFKWESV